MANVIQILVSGLAYGAIYALVALGFVLIFNAVGVVNFAQGEFIMIPSFIGVTLLAAVGLPWPLAYLLVLAAMVVFGLLFNYVAFYPLRNRPYLPVVISTIGASIVLRNGAQLVFGPTPQRFPGLFTGNLSVGGVTVAQQYILILAVTIVLLVVQYLLFERTTLGKQLQAVAQDKQMAMLLGINVAAMIAITFIYSALLGGAAALLVAPILTVRTSMGALISLKAFSASIIGGFGNVPGAIAGGLLVGVIEAFAGRYLNPAYTDAWAFVVLIAFLFIRPRGIFGERIAEKA